MTWGNIAFFAIGMVTGAGVIAMILGLCMSNGRSALEGEIVELREIANRQQVMLEMLQNQLKDRELKESR